jgi:lysophospholipase L1-like esterase
MAATLVRAAATAAAAGMALLAAQALAARLRSAGRPSPRLTARTTIGAPDAPPLRLVVLGDATALGVGVDQVTETVGGHLATLLAERPDGPRVELRNVATARYRADLTSQVARALSGPRPDLAVILVGVGDAMCPTGTRAAAARLGAAVRDLRAADVQVIAGTCPDIGALRAISTPLRPLLARYGRVLALHQAAAIRSAGGIPVDLLAQTGTVFRADPGALCHDGFHPSTDGYRVMAHALFPAVSEAIHPR